MGSEKYEVAPAPATGGSRRTARAPFGYYGAKQRIAAQIIRALPLHNAWVEAFCGSAAITLAKRPAPIEVINDVDDQIVNFFDQLRNNTEALCRVVSLTPYARAEFMRARQDMNAGDPLERARRFVTATMMTVNGTIGGPKCGFSFSNSYSREGHEARVNRWGNLPERLAKVAERLMRVRVENRDARELLEMFVDRPATLAYLDPPYFVERRHDYIIDANYEAFHRELLALCKRSKCMILISSYESELYDEVLLTRDGWRKIKIHTRTRETTGIDYARTEILWQNRHFVEAAQNGRVPIQLTKEETTQNKVNPTR